ncbi:MAG: metal-dependent hydrolase [Pyrinomonadaceae bacterium]
MCTIFAHPAVPIVAAVCLPRGVATPWLIAAGILCSIIPDADAIGFSFGVPYGSMFGHRGITHSIAFAAVLAAVLAFSFFRGSPEGVAVPLLYLFLATLSHPMLDMLTNGGSGVALVAPFTGERYFFPWRPIEVSPIGFSFFSPRGWMVIESELWWVWLPAAAVFSTVYFARRVAAV